MTGGAEGPSSVRSPGRVFAEACATQGSRAAVQFDYTISDALLGSRRKPRIPVRSLFTIVNLTTLAVHYYWHEAALGGGVADRIAGAAVRPEMARRFGATPIPRLLSTTAWVQVPSQLMEDEASLASFIDLRLLVRLATAENAALVTGQQGLLNQSDITRITRPRELGPAIVNACVHVEQMGGTADGVILNPEDYWRYVSSSRLIADLEDQGAQISRTRLMKAGEALVGDFSHGALLFDSGRSVIGFAEPPPDLFLEPGLAVMAQIHERLVLNLPMNFCHVVVDA